MQVQPYLYFDGRCEEALEFYRRALGAEVTSPSLCEGDVPVEVGAQRSCGDCQAATLAWMTKDGRSRSSFWFLIRFRGF